MYTYEYERVQSTGFIVSETKGYREIIDRRAKDGWRYAGFIPVCQSGHGLITDMDLIFEKEVSE